MYCVCVCVVCMCVCGVCVVCLCVCVCVCVFIPCLLFKQLIILHVYGDYLRPQRCLLLPTDEPKGLTPNDGQRVNTEGWWSKGQHLKDGGQRVNTEGWWSKN